MSGWETGWRVRRGELVARGPDVAYCAETDMSILVSSLPPRLSALLAGSQSNALTPSRLLRLSKNLPHDWKEQRCFLCFAA